MHQFQKAPPLYPYLFGLMPLLGFFVFNIDEVPPLSEPFYIFIGAVMSSLLATWMGLKTLGRFLKAKRQGPIWVTLFWLVFYSYGYLYESTGLRHVVLIPALLFALFLFCNWVLIRKIEFSAAWLNSIALIWLGLCLIEFGVWGWHAIGKRHFRAGKVELPQSVKRPDVYYIVLDMYAHHGTLKEFYNFDNSKFLNALKEIGFYVVENSLANYAHTRQSLAATLNMQYVNWTANSLKSNDSTIANEMITENSVMKQFQSMGYQTHVVATGEPTRFTTGAQSLIDCTGYDPFLHGMLDSTLLRPLFGIFERKTQYLGRKIRNMVLCGFSGISKTAKIPGPKFVFSHLYMPHPPFIFGPNGENWAGRRDISKKKRFVAQTQFTNKLLLKTLQDILSQSDELPIVVIQSDHGPAFDGNWEPEGWLNPTLANYKERMRVLNVWLGPKSLITQLKTTMTSVNTFPTIFKYQFGLTHQLLNDKVYFSVTHRLGDSTDFKDVTAKLISVPLS